MPTPKTANSELRIKNFPLKNSIFKRSSKIAGKEGFTLIELLIVVAIIGILSTIVLANYNSFGTRQEVKNAAGKLKSELRKYQNFAISGQKNPTALAPGNGCNDNAKTLDSYLIEIDTSNNRYRAVLDCTTDTVNLPYTNIPSSLAVTTSCASMEIRFKPVNENTKLTCGGTAVGSVYAQLTGSSVSYRVYITESGEIYDERQP